MKTIILFFLGLILISCGEDSPSENQAKEDISEIISTGTSEKVTLIELEKTDGLKKSEDGTDLYIMDIKGKIKFLKETYSEINVPFSVSDRIAGFLEVKDKKPIYSNYELIKENSIYKIKGAVEYIKKEKGWKIKNLKLKIVE
ncbi:hypothetical protein CAPN002_00340 [Capnocytophaga stomatis]|uniref:hypothetical protein n=1 Tax=Capnocytophaga stomatis TaxID=1848904 RepID=UPI00194F6A48|nr:hypothetical protein [Capnocytophaga stomatis]GIJ92816.1 hypothetical protein CAPN002_00340 [Capnocytophaga stomatis]